MNQIRHGLRESVRRVIFEADTRAGRAFDVGLIVCIALSVVAVMLDSVHSIHATHSRLLYEIEWVFTALFTIEYLLRLWSVDRPVKYALSFYGLVDLLAVIPTYLSLLFPGSQYMLVIRVLRVLPVFRVLKVVQYVSEANLLMQALRDSRRKIAIFLFTVMTLVIILGALMYLIEGEENGYTSIPTSIYWTVVTLTTVGFGDITPQTPLGQTVASLIMIIGYGIIAVPTGIVTVSLTRATEGRLATRVCPVCVSEGHEHASRFCKNCGAELR